MSRKRQRGRLERTGDRKSHITTFERDYPSGHIVPLHFHDWDQLVYASRGVMTVRTSEGAWVVPPQRAVWIPAMVPHTLTMSGIVAMRTLYLRKFVARALPRTCSVINVSPLLKELILHACGIGSLRKTNRLHRHLIEILLDQFKMVQMVSLQLPHPTDPRAVRVAEILTANPGDRRTLAQICKTSGASRRTLERLFQEDVGMTFGRWRQQLRLMHSMRLLAEGAKVTYAALETGYNSSSAFISMFKKTLGTSPTRYFTMTKRDSSA
jgi:AraC-like DNA-binding protein